MLIDDLTTFEVSRLKAREHLDTQLKKPVLNAPEKIIKIAQDERERIMATWGEQPEAIASQEETIWGAM